MIFYHLFQLVWHPFIGMNNLANLPMAKLNARFRRANKFAQLSGCVLPPMPRDAYSSNPLESFARNHVRFVYCYHQREVYNERLNYALSHESDFDLGLQLLKGLFLRFWRLVGLRLLKGVFLRFWRLMLLRLSPQ